MPPHVPIDQRDGRTWKDDHREEGRDRHGSGGEARGKKAEPMHEGQPSAAERIRALVPSIGDEVRMRHLDSPAMPNDDRMRAALRWLPPPAVLLAATAGIVMFAIVFAKGIRDADYFWHITAGRLIATTGRVPATDPFSFTWAELP